MLVQDIKTGEWYDPQAKFNELLVQQPWVIDVIAKLIRESYDDGVRDQLNNRARD
jgi:hypothetical protein